MCLNENMLLQNTYMECNSRTKFRGLELLKKIKKITFIKLLFFKPRLSTALASTSYNATAVFKKQLKWKWRDMWPSMVTHTLNMCSAINPSKVHTHSSEHTPRAVGSRLCCGAWGAVVGLVPCSRAPQSWDWRWRERWTFTLPSYNSFRPETRTRHLWITSPTL